MKGDSMEPRIAEISRKTKETDIKLKINLDGTGKCLADTGIGFFDHMLDGFARHGLFDLEVTCKGDLYVDSHHTIEDVGIVLGTAIAQAVGDKKGIKRYGSAMLPMDEALVLCAIDLSAPLIGDMQSELIYDFFYAISYSASLNLHTKNISGRNNHHVAESSFKAFGKALDMATAMDGRIQGVWSTKGTL